MNVKELSDDQLIQHIVDAENEVVRLKLELACRLEAKYPGLQKSFRETLAALNQPSPINRLFIKTALYDDFSDEGK
jgi:hypothetical protein